MKRTSAERVTVTFASGRTGTVLVVKQPLPPKATGTGAIACLLRSFALSRPIAREVSETLQREPMAFPKAWTGVGPN